jgi:phosphate transport system permease protein
LKVDEINKDKQPSKKKHIRYRKSFKLGEFLIEKIIFIAGISTIIFVLFIIGYLFYESLPLFFEYNILDFLFGTSWSPTSPTNPQFGIVPLVYGTLLVTGIALLISVPIGISVAIYISQIAKSKEREFLKPLLELSAGIPSVIYGFFAFITLGSVLQYAFNLTFRLNAFNGGLIIGIMALPTIVSISEDAITAVPKGYNQAALALGASKWESIIGVIVPAAKTGIVASVMLGLGRAIGETMAVILATGNSPQILLDIFAPVQTLTSPPALEMGEVAYGSIHYHALFAVCLVLFVMTVAINLIADFIVKGGFKRKFRKERKSIIDKFKFWRRREDAIKE